MNMIHTDSVAVAQKEIIVGENILNAREIQDVLNHNALVLKVSFSEGLFISRVESKKDGAVLGISSRPILAEAVERALTKAQNNIAIWK